VKRKEINPKTKRVLLIILSVLLAVILIALILGTAYMEKMLNLINRNPDDSTISSEEYQEFLEKQEETLDSNYTGETDDPNDVQWESNKAPVTDEEHIINIMLIGQDRRPGQGRQRSDVMVLCTVNKSTQELTLTSFMRDMYVPIPGYEDNKMNATYAFGGMKLLDKCLENSFGIHVDGNIEVDFDGFRDVIDLMGGVEINLTNSEANHLISKGYKVHAGVCQLDGRTALIYVRTRSVGNGDFDRTGRQRKLLNALIDKCKGMSLNQMKNLLEKALPMITTDMSNRQLLDYLMELVPILANLKVNNLRIPADNTSEQTYYKYAYYKHAGSVLVPDLEANRQKLQEIMAKAPE